MNRGANSADALRPNPRFAGVATAEDQFNAAEHCSGTPGIGDRTTFHLSLDAEMALDAGHGIYNNACHKSLLGLDGLIWVGFLVFRGSGFPARAIANRAGDSVNDGCAGDSACQDQANLSRGDIHAEARNLRQPFIERRLSIPEAVRGTGEATVPGFHGPTGLVVPSHVWAIESGLGPFAAHFVEAPSPAMSFVSPFLGVSTGIVMGTALALVVDDAAVGEQRAVIMIHGGQFAKGEVVDRTATVLAGFCGQPGMLMRVIPGTASWSPTAPVGFGLAATSPPSQAQAPTAMDAAALPQTSRAISSAVRPPTVQ